jgi:hypothetical protein
MSTTTLTKPAPAALKTVLATSADAISLHHSRLDQINRKAQDEALLPALCIGLHCLRAHCAFVVTKDQRKGVGGRGKKTPSTVEGVSPGGFEGWLATLNEERNLKISTGSAYRAMTALKGLGLDHDATEKQVSKALQQLRRKGPVTLKSLCDAAVEAVGPPPAPPAKIEQTEFEFLREGLSAFRQQADALIALKTQLHENPDMERVASARVYSLLYQLTGTHWKPSDEPDDLASINPDAIEL